MSKVVKPEQIKLEVNNEEYVVQLLPAIDAFMAREDYSVGELCIHLINKCIVHPNIKATDLKHPNDIRDLGLQLIELHYVDDRMEKELEKKSEGN